MSTTDPVDLLRLGSLVKAVGGQAAQCPDSGGCHRAASGTISIFVGSERPGFDQLLPVLSRMGSQVLHTGRLGRPPP
jgi:3-hydroxyisobutyrate dehydrogenase